MVLLLPVAVFIATAVRFGGERRDRRLAALRLVGADSRMTRRIAAGEALARRRCSGWSSAPASSCSAGSSSARSSCSDVSVFPADLDPAPALAAADRASRCRPPPSLVTLFALRGVVIEPLGVVRTAQPARRRLWWRLLLPLAGLAPAATR